MSIEFKCPGKKPWEYTGSGLIKINGEDIISPYTVAKVAVHYPLQSGENGCIRITDCYEREKLLWFSFSEEEQAKVMIASFEKRVGKVSELENKIEDNEEDIAPTANNGSSDVAGKTRDNAAAAQTGYTAVTSSQKGSGNVDFRAENPAAIALNKKGRVFLKIGEFLYNLNIVLSWLSLVGMIISGMITASEADSFPVFLLFVLIGGVMLGAGYLSAIIDRFIFECISDLFIGKAHIVQNTTVSARTNLYMAENRHGEKH